MPYDPTKDANSRATYETARKATAVTPSDSTDLTAYARSLYVGGAGNVAVIMADQSGDTAVTFVGVAAGTVLPVQVRRVMSTNTTATNILALY